ncbi:arginase family protein [Carboxylicivirga sp. A043]|uniref:arginase family protein n=1 Tax=Carboxylicivirga litoralis TaxID=2816963 RepID=UPI0021CB0D68|nr:arginase family protein [Carboxylicivirga sp. A043]MCU4156477.1 arginase family protein [Carboxylicivirga sp. A043]
MTEDWIHYFAQPNYQITEAFVGSVDERLNNQITPLQSPSSINWDEVDVAIIGIIDSRNSAHKGCDMAPDKTRGHLYGLRSLSKPLKIVDMGNLLGNTLDDRYKALEDIINKLLELKVLPIIIGGSQDYTLPMVKGLRHHKSNYNLAIIDSKIDWLVPEQDFSASSYLGFLCDNGLAPADLSIIAAQKYLFSSYQEEQIKKHSFDILRLGQIRQQGHKVIEPPMRDADALSVDMTCVRQCDQPAHLTPMPNGLSGEELCQCLWYAGQSDRLKVFGLFELDTQLDTKQQGVVLKAQAIWHILEGIALRYNDYPVKDLDSYRQFIVYLEDYELEIKFYNNHDNDRWWVEIPGENNDAEVIACARNDFDAASTNEIPEKWFRYIQKKRL